MATIRQGYSDDFTIKNSKVGIGTSDPTEALEVIGGSRTKDITVTGIASLTSYEGFQNKKTSYAITSQCHVRKQSKSIEANTNTHTNMKTSAKPSCCHKALSETTLDIT